MVNTSGRSPCPICHGLDIFGDKWTLLIIRDLMFRNKTSFKSLLAAEEGISSNILASRLKLLEKHELLGRFSHRFNKKQVVYLLTEKAESLVSLMLEMIRWGEENGAGGAAPRMLINNLQRDFGQTVEQTKRAMQSHRQHIMENEVLAN